MPQWYGVSAKHLNLLLSCSCQRRTNIIAVGQWVSLLPSCLDVTRGDNHAETSKHQPTLLRCLPPPCLQIVNFVPWL